MLSVWALEGIPEIGAGDDLAAIIADAAAGSLRDGDILVVTSKIASKAEGRLILTQDREAAIDTETMRTVASRARGGRITRIVQNRNGLVMAAAGVDASNTPDGTIVLLPVDPDASAHALAESLRRCTGARVGVIVSDTFGRPWRLGQTDVAIGAAGVRVADDLRGTTDAFGRPLEVTIAAVADEIAAAADLVKGKTAGLPVAVLRGLDRLVADLDQPGAAALVRGLEDDMFRRGSDEAYADGYRDGANAASGTGAS